MESPAAFPRVIWMLWFQGFDNAPDVVRMCLYSWKLRNPGWKVIELDAENLADYIDSEELAKLNTLTVKPQKLANLIRLYLISRHGGVWTDATCFCCQPLDRWLPDYMTSGFFAFRNPAPERIVANWFLAASRGNELASTCYEAHRDLFLKNKFALQGTKVGAAIVRKMRDVLQGDPRRVQWWTSPLLTKTLQVYPYFIFHYHFARIVREDPVCRDIWSRTPPFSAHGPCRTIHRKRLFEPIGDELLTELYESKQPMYKLTWKHHPPHMPDDSTLGHIMRSIGWTNARQTPPLPERQPLGS